MKSSVPRVPASSTADNTSCFLGTAASHFGTGTYRWCAWYGYWYMVCRVYLFDFKGSVRLVRLIQGRC
jgi:hypothetical protein